MRTADQSFLAELNEEARTAFLRACPPFTMAVLLWSGFDWLLAPEWWALFLTWRLAAAAVAAGLFVVSYRRYVDRHRLVLLTWVLSIAVCIAAMLPLIEVEVLAYYTMGYSLCVLGLSTFGTMRPGEVAVGLLAYLVAFVPTAVLRGFDATGVVASAFFLVTLCMAALFQAVQRYLAAHDRWEGRLALAIARDEALAADREKSSFLARMSHELRTPLNAIIGYAELVGEDQQDAQTREDLSRIEGAGKHLLALINDVLDLSKVAAGELDVRDEQVDLAHCLAELRPLAEKLAERGGNALAWDVGAVQVRADPLRVRQVVLNLVANAAKFTDGGTVSVAAGDERGQAVVSVSDDGIGMDDEQLARAFLPFVQVHEDPSTYGGTGLGLALSQQLAARMGGRLEAESKAGIGSCFRLVLPAA